MLTQLCAEGETGKTGSDDGADAMSCQVKCACRAPRKQLGSRLGPSERADEAESGAAVGRQSWAIQFVLVMLGELLSVSRRVYLRSEWDEEGGGRSGRGRRGRHHDRHCLAHVLGP